MMNNQYKLSVTLHFGVICLLAGKKHFTRTEKISSFIKTHKSFFDELASLVRKRVLIESQKNHIIYQKSHLKILQDTCKEFIALLEQETRETPESFRFVVMNNSMLISVLKNMEKTIASLAAKAKK